MIGSCAEQQTFQTEVDPKLAPFIEAAGGLDRWKKVTSFSFQKETEMYKADSTVELSYKQVHTFSNYPEFTYRIEYLDDEKNRMMEEKAGKVSYYENGAEVSDPELVKKAAKSLQTAYYVIGLPFKFTDQGPKVINVQEENNPELGPVITVKLDQYEEGKRKDEDWWVYFDPELKTMRGYLIYHDDRYSYLLNESDINVNGFTLPVYRKGMAMNSNRTVSYLRTKYLYSDYQIEIDE